MSKALIALLSAAILSGCAAFHSNRYAVSVSNIHAIKVAKGKAVNVGAFDSFEPGISTLNCRGAGSIKTDDSQPFSEYIKKALVDELKMAEVYSVSGPVTITGRVNSLDFSSTSANWNLSVTFSSNTGQSITINHNHGFRTSYNGDAACMQTAQAFGSAVQDLIGKFVRSDEFAAMVK